MSYKIPEDCIFCGTCAEECPTQAIYEGEEQYHIDPEKCNECVGFFESPRCAEACPLQLPEPDPEQEERKSSVSK
jgi:ferredoxin